MAKTTMNPQQAYTLFARLFELVRPPRRAEEAASIADLILTAARAREIEYDQLSRAYGRYALNDLDDGHLQNSIDAADIVPLGQAIKHPLLNVGRALMAARRGDYAALPFAIADMALVAQDKYSSFLVDETLARILSPLLDLAERDRPTLSSVLATLQPAVAAPSAPLRLWIDPGRASEEDIRAVLRALSELHVAAGGGGLTFEVDETDSLILYEAEA